MPFYLVVLTEEKQIVVVAVYHVTILVYGNGDRGVDNVDSWLYYVFGLFKALIRSKVVTNRIFSELPSNYNKYHNTDRTRLPTSWLSAQSVPGSNRRSSPGPVPQCRRNSPRPERNHIYCFTPTRCNQHWTIDQEPSNKFAWYWVPQKLPQISTVNLYICIVKVAWFAVYSCGNMKHVVWMF